MLRLNKLLFTVVCLVLAGCQQHQDDDILVASAISADFYITATNSEGEIIDDPEVLKAITLTTIDGKLAETIIRSIDGTNRISLWFSLPLVSNATFNADQSRAVAFSKMYLHFANKKVELVGIFVYSCTMKNIYGGSSICLSEVLPQDECVHVTRKGLGPAPEITLTVKID